MKKLIFVLLLCGVLVLSACGGDENKGDETEGLNSPDETVANTEETGNASTDNGVRTLPPIDGTLPELVLPDLPEATRDPDQTKPVFTFATDASGDPVITLPYDDEPIELPDV